MNPSLSLQKRPGWQSAVSLQRPPRPLGVGVRVGPQMPANSCGVFGLFRSQFADSQSVSRLQPKPWGLRGEHNPAAPTTLQKCFGGQKAVLQQVSSTQKPGVQLSAVPQGDPIGCGVGVCVAVGVAVGRTKQMPSRPATLQD